MRILFHHLWFIFITGYPHIAHWYFVSADKSLNLTLKTVRHRCSSCSNSVPTLFACRTYQHDVGVHKAKKKLRLLKIVTIYEIVEPERVLKVGWMPCLVFVQYPLPAGLWTNWRSKTDATVRNLSFHLVIKNSNFKHDTCQAHLNYSAIRNRIARYNHRIPGQSRYPHIL